MALTNLSVVDTNFLQTLKSHEGAAKFIKYCAAHKIPLANNILMPPDFIIEYTGIIKNEQELPILLEFTIGTDFGKWLETSIANCKKHYSPLIEKLIDPAIGELEHKMNDKKRSET